MPAYGASTGNYSAASIRAARQAGRASAGDQIKNGKFIDNTGGTNNFTQLRNAVGGGSLSDMYDNEASSKIAQLKQAIQQGIRGQKDIIKNAPQVYQPMRNTSEVQRYDNLRTVLEQSANAGDRGGVGRQNALETQTQADNRLNSINLQQQNVIDAANQNIADIEASGSLEETRINADSAAAKLRAMIEQDQRDMEFAFSREQFDANQKQQALENSWKQKELEYELGKPYYKPSSSGGSGNDLTNSNIISAYSNGLIDEEQAYSLLGISNPNAVDYYSDVDRKLGGLSVPSSKMSLIRTYNQQGKLTDAQAQALLAKYGLD